MIRIEKKAEPHSWTEHRLTEGAKYEATSDLKMLLCLIKDIYVPTVCEEFRCLTSL